MCLRQFRNTLCVELDGASQQRIDDFTKAFLTLFTDADFIVPNEHRTEYVRLNETISNLVALSQFRTTDAFLEMLGPVPVNLVKFLTLCSARNQIKLDRKAFFDVDPALACTWFGAYAEIYRTGLLNPVVWFNLKNHFAFEDDRLDVQFLPMTSYFASTYVGDDLDRVVRAAINRSWRSVSGQLQSWVKNRPDRKKIGILSSGWTPSHSAYRITKAFVEALKGYHLTFVPLGSRTGLDFGLFDEVKTLAVNRDGVVNVRGVLENDYSLVYYPEVGLSTESILLTNLRIAPIQIATLGHSVSTWGQRRSIIFSVGPRSSR